MLFEIPADMRAPHQCTYAAQGPNASWEYLAKVSPVIPVYRDVVTAMGKAFPTSANGTSHTSPDKWSDIAILVNRYMQERVTCKTPEFLEDGSPKQVRTVKPSRDAIMIGHKAMNEGALDDWAARRRIDKSDRDDWDGGSDSDDQSESSDKEAQDDEQGEGAEDEHSSDDGLFGDGDSEDDEDLPTVLSMDMSRVDEWWIN